MTYSIDFLTMLSNFLLVCVCVFLILGFEKTFYSGHNSIRLLCLRVHSDTVLGRYKELNWLIVGWLVGQILRRSTSMADFSSLKSAQFIIKVRRTRWWCSSFIFLSLSIWCLWPFKEYSLNLVSSNHHLSHRTWSWPFGLSQASLPPQHQSQWYKFNIKFSRNIFKFLPSTMPSHEITFCFHLNFLILVWFCDDFLPSLRLIIFSIKLMIVT